MAMKSQSHAAVEKALPFRYQFAAGAVAGISEVCHAGSGMKYLLMEV